MYEKMVTVAALFDIKDTNKGNDVNSQIKTLIQRLIRVTLAQRGTKGQGAGAVQSRNQIGFV
jgi:hypothetical protein